MPGSIFKPHQEVKKQKQNTQFGFIMYTSKFPLVKIFLFSVSASR